VVAVQLTRPKRRVNVNGCRIFFKWIKRVGVKSQVSKTWTTHTQKGYKNLWLLG
jgi:hypothetical protein